MIRHRCLKRRGGNKSNAGDRVRLWWWFEKKEEEKEKLQVKGGRGWVGSSENVDGFEKKKD